ncbi:MAG TPA: proline dehydrogenase family protein, partial [Pirellulaceae bacterium]|nr:proline dehydrogenase family protein [Pirellulaceae bacterium]
WPQAPYLTKLETDANYKRMLVEALRTENLAAARVGVASHNLLDLALAIVLTDEAGGFDRVHFEMLEGMAHSVRRALLAQQQPMLLYAPACKQDEFLNAIGYLMRRLDENTGPENFLRHAFKLVPDSDDWKLLEQGFRAACETAASDEPRRRQNRLTERFDAPIAERPWNQLDGEPDTDFSLPANSTWAEQLLDGLATFAPSETAGPIPLVIDGEAVTHHATRLRDCLDPSRPGAVVARYVEADGDDVERAVAVAKYDADGWRTMSVDRRSEILGHAAVELRRSRGRLMQAALLDGGKLLTESDPEVSEAIDFVEFYRASARWWYEHFETVAAPRGVVVVAPPWNFPIAIPCGGIVAALAAGNTVIMKPASDTVLVAWELCNCLWRGGVSRRALQFVPCSGAGAGSRLAAHDDVDTVVLTGGTSTGEKMLAAKPTLRLLAETGGKNATIITALSDRELAIKHVIHSAFSHSGQKCSATSLLLLEAEIYDDPAFKHVLCDAVRSLRVGPADDLAARVGPLIRPPSGDLEVALKTLEPGETWAVMPRQIGDNPRVWSPGVKYGVTPGSFTHRTELFGPVLGVMRFETLDEAIQIVNATGYGLTSGLHSLDDREQRKWRESIRAGNLYVNRGTTGAIVLRQPFGGLGLSSMGPGMKAGGPNYVAQLLRFDDSRAKSVDSLPLIPPLAELSAALDTVGGELLGGADRARLERALESYSHWWREEFSREHDHFQLLGQDNVRR